MIEYLIYCLQSVLDLTYFYENKVTEKAFPADTTLAKLNDILSM